MVTVLLEGVKSRLRDWREDDLTAFAHWMQPHHLWQQLDGPYYPRPMADEVLEMVARWRAQIVRGDWPQPRRNLAIAERENDKLLGTVTWYWESEETNWLSVGIVVYDERNWGKGIGYEALGLWGDYLFNAMPELARLDLRTWSGNAGMMRLAEKLGYKQEARFRKARIVDGQYYDGIGYGVLREEWQQMYPQGFAAQFV